MHAHRFSVRLTTVALFIGVLGQWLSAQDGMVIEHQLGTNASPYGYVEYLPGGYSDPANATKKYPLWIFLAGSGERGNGTTELFDRSTTHGPMREARYNGRDYPGIVVTPQTSGWFDTENWKLNDYLNFLKSNYRIDADRVMFSGMCAGGAGAMQFAQRYPEQLACIFPIIDQGDVVNAPGLKDLPAWHFHAFGDPYVTRDHTIRWANSQAAAVSGYTDSASVFSLDLGGQSSIPNAGVDGTGSGLAAEYFDNMDLTLRKVVRVDPTINFNWAGGAPDPSIGPETFSARWTGKIAPLYSENYTFIINSDNGRRVWVNGQLIIDKWIDDWNVDYSGSINLVAGQKYDIKVEYFENGGGAGARLEWMSPSQARQVIPASQLTPAVIPASTTYMNGGGVVSLGQPASLTCLDPKQEWTVSLWVKRKEAISAGAVLAKGSSAASRSVYITSTGSVGYSVEVGGVSTVSNFGNGKDTNWHHLAIVNRNNGGTFMSHLVFDGFMVSGETAGGSALGTGYDITLGARRSLSNSDSANNLNANFDDITFWNRALSNDEVKQVFSRPENWTSSSTVPGLVAWYRGGEAETGNILRDSAGTANGMIAGTFGFSYSEVAKWSLVGWGDSLTFGLGGNSSYLLKSPLRNGRAVSAQGVGGEGSTAIKARFDASSGSRRAINVIWSGRNGVLTDNGQIATDIQGMVNSLPSDGRYLVLSITNKRDGSEDLGTAKYAKITAVNDQLAAKYGNRFVNVRAALIAAATSPGDDADVALDRIPASLTISDGMHLNDAGYVVVASAVRKALLDRGWDFYNAMDNYPYGSGANGLPDPNLFALNNQTGAFRAESGWSWTTGIAPVANVSEMFTLYSNYDHGCWQYTINNPTVLHWAFAQRRQSPFTGIPVDLPGTIEAEAYDFGSPGRAYNELTAANSGGSSFRAEPNPFDGTLDMSPVDLANGATGVYLTGTQTGEWLKYTVNVAIAGTYNLNASVASATTGSAFHFERNGVAITPVLLVPATGGATTFVPLTVPGIALPAGVAVLRLVVDAGGFNLDRFTLDTPPVPIDLTLDNQGSSPQDFSTTGAWTTTAATPGFYGADYLSSAPGALATATFKPYFAHSGNFLVYLQYPSNSTRGVAPVTVTYADGSQVFTTAVDQSINGGSWYLLGGFSFAKGRVGSVQLSNAGATGAVSADAIRFVEVATLPAIDRVYDNLDRAHVVTTGPWSATAFMAGFYGSNYLSAATGTNCSATFRPIVESAGFYDVYVQYPSNTSRGVSPIDIASGDGSTLFVTAIDQSRNGGTWNYMGTFAFAAGSGPSVTVRSTGATGYVSADAVRLKQVPAIPLTDLIIDNQDKARVTVTGPWSATTVTPGYYGPDYLSIGPAVTNAVKFKPLLPRAGRFEVSVWFPSKLGRGTSPVTVAYGAGSAQTITVPVNQSAGGGQWVVLGTVDCEQGAGPSVTVGSYADGGWISADAVRYREVPPAGSG